MTTNRIDARLQRTALPCAILAVFFASGCAAPVDTQSLETVSATEDAFSTAACATAQANAGIVGTGSVTSPRTYNTCGKGYVVDVHHSTSTEAGAVWNDDLPTTAAGCRDISITLKYYERPEFENVFAGEVSRRGIWLPYPASVCVPPLVGLPVSASDYRLAATARVSTGELTRKMIIFAGN